MLGLKEQLELESSKEKTREHISLVARFLMQIANQLLERAQCHDNSKLQPPEVEVFAKYTAKLKDCTYNSDEYKQFLKEMKPALDHHYAHNSHHPEYYENGINGMNILDLVEMFCDWQAAGMRHADGNLKASIEKNTERFNLSPQIVDILNNSVTMFD